ncbi:MAG: recombinase RecA [Novosphingobium sp.]|nr:recombinase RecA [Novosphingobium sp.]
MAKDTIGNVIASIDKEFGKGTVINFEENVKDIEFISSGSIALDIALGGGYPKGRIIEAYGAESSGKTTAALHAIVEVQKEGLIAVYFDYENALDPVYMASVGVDLSKDKLLIVYPESTEQGFEMMRRFVKAEEVGIIVIDSVAAMVPKSELQGDFGDSKMGLQARAMSQAMRMLVSDIKKSDCIAYFINQTRDKIGVVFGDPTTTTGGNALKFYASQRLRLAKSTSQKDKEGETISTTTKITIDKNKVAPPKRKCQINIRYGEGFDRYIELIEMGVELGIINKSGSWFNYGDVKLGQGQEAVRVMLMDNPELSEEVEHKIRMNVGLIEE